MTETFENVKLYYYIGAKVARPVGPGRLLTETLKFVVTADLKPVTPVLPVKPQKELSLQRAPHRRFISFYRLV